MILTGHVVTTNIASFHVDIPETGHILILQHHAKSVRYDETGSPVWVDLSPGWREDIPEVGTRIKVAYDPLTQKAFAWMDAGKYDRTLGLTTE